MQTVAGRRRILRLVVPYSPHAAQEANARRRERMPLLEATWVGKVDALELEAKARGRKLSDSSAKV